MMSTAADVVRRSPAELEEFTAMSKYIQIHVHACTIKTEKNTS